MKPFVIAVPVYLLRTSGFGLFLACLCAFQLKAQSGNLAEVMRYKGIWGYVDASTVRATQHGVAIALTVRTVAPGSGLLFLSTVIAITDRGIDTVPLGDRLCSQAVVWRDTVFSALYTVHDTVFIATALQGHSEKSYVVAGRKRLATNINCIDGSLSIYDVNEGITFLLNQTDSIHKPIPYGDAIHLEMFSLKGDIYLFPEVEAPRYIPFGTNSSIAVDSAYDRASTKVYFNNVSVINDSVVWIDQKSRRWALSMTTRDHTVTQYAESKDSPLGGCAGRWGYLSVSPYSSNPADDEEYTSQIVVRYTHGNGIAVLDTIHRPYIHRSGLGVGWWNGSFYFTAEVRDSGAPYESAESIIYKYTEPIPVVSVEDQLPNSEKADLAERLAFTQEAYANWRDGLGAEVTVYDLLGNEVHGFVVPHTGVYCVRGLGKVWLVSVTP
ncbi:MAG: hypothetical protein IPI24_06440 [Ignavibacteria bacterium]|nr:hypothetical protein [Ignavibacteria bacterium]MBK7413555.1 hypothetical protein [Ignavibacteria bacterium]MBK7577056.1 hypothetical protein [Ignavibacteria bacterium]